MASCEKREDSQDPALGMKAVKTSVEASQRITEIERLVKLDGLFETWSAETQVP